MLGRVIEVLISTAYSLNSISELIEVLADVDKVLVSNALMLLLAANTVQS